MEQQELLGQFAAVEQLVLHVSWLDQRRLAQELTDFGLTPPQFFVLRSVMLRDKNPTMSTLAYDTLQHCATLTGIVDRLAKMGLVTRHHAVQDRRQVVVELTQSGRDVMERVRLSRETRLRSTLDHLSEQDARDLLRLLRIYLEALRIQYVGPEEIPQEPPLPRVHGRAAE